MENSIEYSLIRAQPYAVSHDACLALFEAGYAASIDFPLHEQKEVNIGTLRINRFDPVVTKILGIYGFVLGGRIE